MEDRNIVRLYLRRDETALEETDRKYRSYCLSIARNIVGDPEDAAECVNDTWLAAWNSIPPHEPERLDTYLGKIARRMALRRWRNDRAQKRGGGQTEPVLEELADCLPAGETAEGRAMAGAVADGINAFLGRLPADRRRVFVRRYWYLDPVETIARDAGWSVSKVTSVLHRTRVKLREYLIKEELL